MWYRMILLVFVHARYILICAISKSKQQMPFELQTMDSAM